MIADFLEVEQAALAILQTHAGRMQLGIMLCIRCFVAQQVAVGACIEISLIAGTAFFADGQRNRAVGMLPADGADERTDFVICIIKVLAALQHEGAKAQFVAFSAAGKNFLLRKAIALGKAVACTDTAVVAVVFAVIGEFYQPADIDLVAIVLAAELVGCAGQLLVDTVLCTGQQRQQLSVAQIMLIGELGNNISSCL